MATRTEVSTNASGGTDVRTFEIDAQQKHRLDSMLPDGSEHPHSEARARLARARTGKLEEGQSRFVPVQHDGEDKYFARRLTLPQCTRVHLESSRNGDGALDIEHDAGDLTNWSVALLQSCIYTDERESAPLFASLDEAAEWVNDLDAGVQVLVRAMTDTAVAATPLLVPRSVIGRAMPSQMSPASPPSQAESEASMTSTTTSGAIGSMPTGSSEPPATSHTSSESSPPTDVASDGP